LKNLTEEVNKERRLTYKDDNSGGVDLTNFNFSANLWFLR